MDQTVAELLRQGLIMTGIGMGLVFSALALLWGMIRLLDVLWRDRPGVSEAAAGSAQANVAQATAADAQAAAALSVERARVAAIVAGALVANALPLLLEPPAGPAFEHGRTAPSWVTANRARTLGAWTPPRVLENHPAAEHYA